MDTVVPTAAEVDKIQKTEQEDRPLVSIVVPGYNEAAIAGANLQSICNYMEGLEDRYRWELIFVDDGSSDGTGEIADAFAKGRGNVQVVRHMTNFRMGQALRSAFNYSRGDYIVTMDLDLSYSLDHIEKLLTKMLETKARVVVASPYMNGGKTSDVPWLRRKLSRWANRYLSFTAQGNLSTLTGMVRAYDGRFIRSLSLKSMDTEINEEIIYKTQLLNARIVEIPAHLDWGFQKAAGRGGGSSLKIFKKIISCAFSGFIFKPFMFFVAPGLLLMVVSFYPLAWALIHTVTHYRMLSSSPAPGRLDYLFSDAIAAAFIQSPHSFLVGGFTLMLALQLISLGIIALQSKRYFEDLFHLGTSIYRNSKENVRAF
jgi:glycosyltransferase involved in cell wall biosynthesis